MDIPPGQHMKPPFRHRLAVLAQAAGRPGRGVTRRARASARRAAVPRRPGRCWRRRASMAISGARSRRAASMPGTIASRTSAAAKLGWIARAGGQAMRRKRLYPAGAARSRHYGRGHVVDACANHSPCRTRQGRRRLNSLIMTMLSLKLSRALVRRPGRAAPPPIARRCWSRCCASAPPRTMSAPTSSRRCCATRSAGRCRCAEAGANLPSVD